MTAEQTMQVEVRDHVLWIRHITAPTELKAWLEEIPAGASVRLTVNGVAGDWRKMEDGADGRPTAGFKPVTEPSRARWNALQSSRGLQVSFAVDDAD